MCVFQRKDEMAWKSAMQQQMLEQKGRQQNTQGGPGIPPSHQIDLEKQREAQQKVRMLLSVCAGRK